MAKYYSKGLDKRVRDRSCQNRAASSKIRRKLCPSIGLPQRAQNARPAPRSLFETLEIVFLVRRVDTVVVQGKTHEQRLYAELGAERFHDWNGTAAAHHHRRSSPFCLESFRRGRKGRRGSIESDRRGPTFTREAYGRV